MRAQFPDAPDLARATAAFARANVELGRPIFFEQPPPGRMIGPDHDLVPAGALWKMVPRGEGTNPASWDFDVDAKAVRARYGRKRGQHLYAGPGGIQIEPEAYERRLVRLLIKSRRELARVYEKQGTPESRQKAQEILSSILWLDPD
jgi:hypothetical protein